MAPQHSLGIIVPVDSSPWYTVISSFLVETFFFLVPNIATALVLKLVAVVAVRVFLGLQVTAWGGYVFHDSLAPIVTSELIEHGSVVVVDLGRDDLVADP